VGKGRQSGRKEKGDRICPGEGLTGKRRNFGGGGVTHGRTIKTRLDVSYQKGNTSGGVKFVFLRRR